MGPDHTRDSNRAPKPNAKSRVGKKRGLDEGSLLARLRTGDEGAFKHLVDKHNATMIRVALRYVDNLGVAEEVVQETWLAFLNGLTRFRGEASVKTWLYAILLNRARSRGAREKRTRRLAVRASDLENEIDSIPLDGAVPHSSPEETTANRQAVGVVLEQIRCLPPLQATVVTLRDLEGWTSREVADTLGISLTYQRVLLHRARKYLRRSLAEKLRRGKRQA